MLRLLADVTQTPPGVPWHPDSFGMALAATVVFGVIGIGLAIAGFKLFDAVTPANLQEEIIQKGNVAAAILGAAIIIGICLIVAAAVG